MIINVPEELQFTLERGMFEYTRAKDNICFLIEQKALGKIDNPIYSKTIEQLEGEAVEAGVKLFVYRTGTVQILCSGKVPSHFYFSPGHTRLEVDDL